MTAPFQFRCAACGRDVPFMDAGLFRFEHRNQCPWCLCSRHVMFGTETLPPCGGLMRPDGAARDDGLLVEVCAGCGFAWVSYDEDWWAGLGPGEQTAMINLGVAETGRLNGAAAVIYAVRREYRTVPPRIPAGRLGSRPRVAARP